MNNDSLQYLRALNTIVIPEEYTYWVHNTTYGKNENPQDKMFEEIPIDHFVVRGRMSFVERNARAIEAVEYGGFNRAAIAYMPNPRGKKIQIRVIMPKQFPTKAQKEKLGLSAKENADLRAEYNGLGDARHPKLKNGEKILIFATSQIDEISRKSIDIFYGVREQDLERYVESVRDLMINTQVKPYILPEKSNVEDTITAFRSSVGEAYSLENGGLSRYNINMEIGKNEEPKVSIYPGLLGEQYNNTSNADKRSAAKRVNDELNGDRKFGDEY